MSKRTERREAERLARKQAFQESRNQSPATSVEPSQPGTTSCSAAQLEANRANAQLSCGPVTEEGKERSSKNALKHGLTGKTVLLPTDNADEYNRKLDIYLNRFNPVGEEELALVQSIVDSKWRLQRLQSLETGILLKGQIEFASKYEDQTPSRRAQLIEVETYLKYEKSIRNLHIQEARLHRRLEKDQAELTRLQIARKRQEQMAPASAPASRCQAAMSPNGFEFSTSEMTLSASVNHSPNICQSAA